MKKLVKQGINNVEAYNWYLRGRYFVEQAITGFLSKGD